MAKEKSSEFLHHHLQTLMKQGELFIKDTGGFLKKSQTVDEIPKGAKLVTAGIVGLYPSVPHDGGLEILRK